MTGKLKILTAWLALLASGCTSVPYKNPVIEPMTPTSGPFAGLRMLAPTKPLKVLVVHGMCTHDSSWVQGWTGAMAKAFGSTGVQRQSDAVGKIVTEHYDFDDHGRKVEVTFAIWSPETQGVKAALAYDSGSNFRYKRAKFNGMAKSILINDCFADPVIYSGSLAPGSVGESLRLDMAGVVCRFLGGVWKDEKCSGAETWTARAFITESLGSKLLVDAVDRLSTANAEQAAPVRAALVQTRAIYMLANQLPLLRLAEARAGTALAQSATPDLRWFGAARGQINATDRSAPLQVVAFTDPNDQFSYRLTYPAIGDTPDRVALFNVIVSNAPTYFGLAENPYPAHVGYWDNPSVPPLVLEGSASR